MRQPAGQLQPPEYPQEPQSPEYGQEPQPQGQQGNVSPTAEAPPQSRQGVAPTSTPIAEPEMPGMSQMAEEWRTIYDQLFEILSFIFSWQFGQFNNIPQWPVWPQHYPVNIQ
jgi:hypothetical protein